MEDKRFIRRLELTNFLSYGFEDTAIDLLPLNVLIGPNGSGKSNLIEALSILRSTPVDLVAAIREGGGISEYIYKGGEDFFGLNAVMELPWRHDPEQPQKLWYYLTVGEVRSRAEIRSEFVEVDSTAAEPRDKADTLLVYDPGSCGLGPGTRARVIGCAERADRYL
jgi:predicted ATPase